MYSGEAQMPQSDSQPLLRARGVRKVFPGTVALDGVDFSLAAGKSMRCWGKTAQANQHSSNA
jgi:ABC-type sugar transport system ATPase subunit